MSNELEQNSENDPAGALGDYLKSRAQYMRDYIDASIYLRLVRGGTGEEAFAATAEFLRDEGWRGRKYPLDYFRGDTVPQSVTNELLRGAQRSERAK